ncbi:MAG: hypothetical protein GX540_02800 [Clostridiales bacterium]|nr:hypothetical protein [Clostridiales bacterium]
MIKRLKRKFVLVNMLVVFLVLTLVFVGGMTAIKLRFAEEYRQELRRELTLDLRTPQLPQFRTQLPMNSPFSRPQRLTFSAVLGEDGAWTLHNSWMQVDQDTLDLLTQRAQEARAETGFWEDLGIAYLKSEGRIAFANLQNEFSQLQSNLSAWLMVYVGALALFLLISLALSRWTLKPVEKSWMQQRHFISDASHELKTPLTVILANLDIAEKETGENQWLASARVEGLQMKRLIEDLLFLARSDEARQKVLNQPLDLSALVGETALAFEALAYENQVALSLDVQKDIRVAGDPGLLRQLSALLIDNAVKYTPKGGEILVKLQTVKDKALLSVRNHPARISKEQLPRLFDRFYRADEARTKPEGGYGLGLSIASEIARQHQSAIKASCTEAEGAVFSISLPLMGQK